ncbi:MAG: nitroreductase [Rhodobacteraceae bacterium]|nr:nitroreductase [Paracoccaceae bacterium]TVR45676.1 MAG: nitroreductase [Paracoccaceae bacterium]
MTEIPPAMEFLLSRRSRPAKLLAPPVPDRDQLMPILTAAARVPDHGKLEPWRFVVMGRNTCTAMAEAVEARGNEIGIDPDKLAKTVRAFGDAHLIVAVIASPKPSATIPEIEQTLSAGAVCLGLVNAALASGWGANWLTGWPAMDATLQLHLGLAPSEWVAGFIHLGTATATPPERPRPDIEALTTWQP